MFSRTFRSFGKIVLKNLNYNLEAESITELVAKYGKVTRVKLFKNHDGRSKGFAFVELAPEENAESVVQQLNEQDIMEHPPKSFDIYRPREQTPSNIQQSDQPAEQSGAPDSTAELSQAAPDSSAEPGQDRQRERRRDIERDRPREHRPSYRQQGDQSAEQSGTPDSRAEPGQDRPMERRRDIERDRPREHRPSYRQQGNQSYEQSEAFDYSAEPSQDRPMERRRDIERDRPNDNYRTRNTERPTHASQDQTSEGAVKIPHEKREQRSSEYSEQRYVKKPRFIPRNPNE